MNTSDMVQWLFDIECIKQLKHRYCAFCDDNYNPEGISSLFSEDGVWDGGVFGRATGRSGIREFFSNVSTKVKFANHYVTNPIIEVDSDVASGRWDLWQPMVMEGDGGALWLVAKYKEQYVRAAEGWLFRSLELDIRALSPYEDGFAKTRYLTM
ncbi:MAG: nuclear transport factor 2 family protein [Gammaproteobacteria bacterium]